MAVMAALPLQPGARAVSQSPDARILAAMNDYALQRRARLVERIPGSLELITSGPKPSAMEACAQIFKNAIRAAVTE